MSKQCAYCGDTLNKLNTTLDRCTLLGSRICDACAKARDEFEEEELYGWDYLEYDDDDEDWPYIWGYEEDEDEPESSEESDS